MKNDADELPQSELFSHATHHRHLVQNLWNAFGWGEHLFLSFPFLRPTVRFKFERSTH